MGDRDQCGFGVETVLDPELEGVGPGEPGIRRLRHLAIRANGEDLGKQRPVGVPHGAEQAQAFDRERQGRHHARRGDAPLRLEHVGQVAGSSEPLAAGRRTDHMC